MQSEVVCLSIYSAKRCQPNEVCLPCARVLPSLAPPALAGSPPSHSSVPLLPPPFVFTLLNRWFRAPPRTRKLKNEKDPQFSTPLTSRVSRFLHFYYLPQDVLWPRHLTPCLRRIFFFSIPLYFFSLFSFYARSFAVHPNIETSCFTTILSPTDMRRQS